MVGDRWRDVGAGRAAGCLTIFVDYGYEQDGPNEPDHVVASLSEAANVILRPQRDALGWGDLSHRTSLCGCPAGRRPICCDNFMDRSHHLDAANFEPNTIRAPFLEQAH